MTKKLKKPIAFLTVFAMLVSMLMYFPAGTFGFDFGVRASAAGTISPSKPASGDGSSGNPYQITSAAELYWFAGLVNGDENVCTGGVTQNRTAHAKLMNDITVNTDVLANVDSENTESLYVWTPINFFSGVFQGSDHTIKGLYIDSTEDNIGFFGENSYRNPSNLKVDNLTLEDCYFKGGDYVGGFAGAANYLNMQNCTIKDSRVIGTGIAGGIVGGFFYGSDSGNIIKDTKNENTYVEGTDTVGGIVGSMYEVTEMTGVTSSGTVVAHQSASKPDDPGFSESLGVGGLIGYLCHSNGTITNCEHSGSVTAEGKRAGGLFGTFGNRYTGVSGGFNVSGCTNSGTVTANYYVGGILGCAKSGAVSIENCVNNGTISQNNESTVNKYGIGGIFGYSDSACHKCANNGTINAPDASDVGGIIGIGSAYKCVNNGSVTGKNSVGGISGYISGQYGNVKNCVNTGDIHGTKYVGGVCGNLGNKAHLTSSYSVGTVEGDEIVGGLLGNMGAQLSYMQYCYFDTAQFDGVAIGYINHTSPNLEVYKMTQSDMEDGTLAYNLSQGDVLAFWVQQLGTDNKPRLSDSLDYTVFPNSDGSGYHNHIGGVCNDGCAIVPDEPTKDGEGVYQISTAGELYWLSLYAPNSDAVLLNDIVINSDIENPTITLQPIGSNYGYTYTGTFDGQGHTISGVYVNDAKDGGGLFGTIAESGTVKNVGVINSSIYSTSVAGGICARNYGTVTGCFDNATVTSLHTTWAEGFCANYGTLTSSYYLEKTRWCDYHQTSGNVMTQEKDDEWALPAEAFASGELAYKLNSAGNLAWGQIIEEGETKDPLPVSNNGTNTVYSGERYHNHLHGETPETCPLCEYPAVVPQKVGDVYQIGTLSELYGFAKIVNSGLDAVAQNTAAKGVLTDNITANEMLLDASGAVVVASPYKWVPIGNGCEFTGSFDGRGYTISGLYTSASQSLSYAGLFGQIGSGATVKNVCVDDCWFEGTASGGIAAANGGTIEGCFAYNLGTATQNDITTGGTVNNCFYLTGGSGDGTAASATKFENGEVAYNLNANPENPVWGQIIGTNPLPVPVTDSNRVYYSNSKYHNHNPNSTYCGNCKIILPKEITPENGIYTISNEGELLWFANLVNSGATDENTKAVLSRDVIISLNTRLANGTLEDGNYAPWTPIGTTTNPFMGSFDGKGYSVKGLYIGDAQSADFAGLFGVTDTSARIENVGIYGCMLSGAVAGGIVANNHGTISGCYTNTIKLTATTSGDICGQSDGTVERCFYLEGGSGEGTAATAAQFKSGEVAYNLNANPENPVWGQIINNGLPVPATAENKVFFAQGVYHNHGETDCELCPVEPDFVENKYQISTERHLLWFAEYINAGNTADAVLLNDIAVSEGFVMIPVGTSEEPFNGSFDGKCYGISNLNINTASVNAGLFGVIGENGKVANLSVISSTIKGSGNVGGIAGTNNGAISGCYTYNVTLTGTATDGLFAEGSGTAVRSFSTSTNVEGAQKSADKFGNGDVAYNLNADPENPVWGQLINDDLLPVAATAENKLFFAQDVYHNHSGERCDWCDELLPVRPEEVDGYFQIENPSNLLWLAEWVNSGHTDVLVKLTGNITLNSDVLDENGNLNSGTFKAWTPIGTDSHPFTGEFNGNGCTISGLYISGAENKVGLFGTVSGGTITKLHIADSYISGSRYVGAVCGYNEGATISECFVESNVTVTDIYGGGICGYNGGTVSDCFHTGAVNGKDSAGIVGQNKDAAKVKNCVNLGKVSGSGSDNICGKGRLESTNDIENCYYNADLTADFSSYGKKYSTMEITADDFLPGSSAVWEKKANDYTNHILYYPNLKSINTDPVEVEYTPAFNLDIENTDPIYYGDDIVFNYEAKLSVYGKETTVTNQLNPLALMGLDFVIESNGEVLYNEFTVSIGSIDGKSVLWLISGTEKIGYIDNSGLTHSITITKDFNPGEYTINITYNGTGIPLFSGMSGECTITIVQAIPTVEVPTASAVDYGETLNESVLSDTGWSWVDSKIIPTVANNGYKAITNEPVDYVNYDYTNVEGYDPVTHLITKTVSVTVNPVEPTIVVKAVPAASLPGKTVTVSAVATNPNNNAMTDLPAVSFSYKIGDAAETPITGGSFVIPKNTAIGTVIKVIGKTSETANYIAGAGSANVIVTDCKHENTVLQYDENSHWYHCDNCGADLDKEEHKGGTATCTDKAVCTVCEQAYGSVDANNHVNVAEEWSADASGHWHECEACHAQVDKAAHTSSGAATEDNPEICTICSYLIQRATGRVATPAITPNGGSFSGSQAVTITCTTENAVIYYTTNGDEPTADSTKYTGAFTISESATVKAIALKYGVDDSEIAQAVFTKNSPSYPVGPVYPVGPSGPIEPAKPSIDNVAMTWSEIAVYLAKLAVGSEVTIQLNGNTKVPVEVVKVIDDRDIKVTFVVDSVKSWKTDGAEIKTASEADLTIVKTTTTMHDGLRGVEGTQFRINATGIPTSLEITFRANHAGKFANLYKSVSGKLVFVGCAKLGENGAVIIPGVGEQGEYVAMLCEFSDLAGDMNNDGILNALDASAILKQIVGLESGKNPLVADLNGDGKVNAFDASAILKRVVGLA